MEIKILGTGCPKCRALEEKTRKVAGELGIDARFEKVDDMAKILEYHILRTPGLVINGKVVSSGRLPSDSEIREMLSQAQ